MTHTTLRDVAELADVSIGTASRALSGRGDLTRATRERVLAAAETLGYSRTATTRGRPPTHDPRLIELVLGSFDDAWTDEIIAGARRGAFACGFDLALTLERDDPSDDWPARIAMRRPSGVILGLIRPTRKQLAELNGFDLPLVLLDPRSDPDGELASIGTTDWRGGHQAGEHLASTGVSRFAVVTGTPPYRFGRERLNGFTRALTDRGVDAASIVHLHASWGGGMPGATLAALFATDRSPLGIFACNDDIALSVYAAAAEAGLRIPHDIGVVGFDDQPRSANVSPPLTTIRQPLREMAARAVELIASRQPRDGRVFERIELPTRLIVRSSTTQ